MREDVFKLTAEQKKAFSELEHAFSKCNDLGVNLIRIDGALYAFNSDYIQGYFSYCCNLERCISDSGIDQAPHFHDDSLEVDMDEEGIGCNHYLLLTEEGLELYNS